MTGAIKNGKLCPVLRKCIHLVRPEYVVPPPCPPTHSGPSPFLKAKRSRWLLQCVLEVSDVSCLFGVKPHTFFLIM